MPAAAPQSIDRPLRARSTRERHIALAGGLIVAVVALGYANSLSAPFLYDDKSAIVYNGSIRHLWPIRDVFSPPAGGNTVNGRPILNLTFALNYAFGGLSVRGYHLVNVVIHALAALTLFGLARRLLLRGTAALRAVALPSAAIFAAIWAAHPLQTESVSYVVQRAEALMSLFYLVTLYCFVRSVDSPSERKWQLLAWTACLLGMGAKENMVSAPIAALLVDRAFFAGTFAAAWRMRRWFYLALGTTWLLLLVLVLSTGGDRGGSVGFDVGVSWLGYALTQFPALVRYAALGFWPHPLVFEYGHFTVGGFAQVAWPIALVVVTIAAALYAFVRYPKVGTIAAIGLAVLAPTSLVPGTTQMIVEHRMYLPLACTLGLLLPLVPLFRPRALGLAGLAVVAALVATTAARNRAYRSELAIWTDTVAKCPNNAVARSSLGAALADAGRRDEAIAEDQRAYALNPNYGPTLANLGIALTESGQPTDALPYVTRAVQSDPKNAQAHLNLGVTLDLLHRAPDALPQYAEAVRLNPLLPAAHNDYGDALSRAGRLDEGIAHLLEAIRLDPNYPDAHLNYAAALVRAGRMSDANLEFARGLELRPTDASAYLSWANLLLRYGHADEALGEFAHAVQLGPKSPDAHYSYATALASRQRYDDAVREYEAALRLRPDYAEAHNNLANTFVALNRIDSAIPHYETALGLRPNDATTHNNLGLALARSGRLREAIQHFAAAVQLAPDLGNARENLAHAEAQLNAAE